MNTYLASALRRRWRAICDPPKREAEKVRRLIAAEEDVEVLRFATKEARGDWRRKAIRDRLKELGVTTW